MTEELQRMLGIAAILLSIGLGLGACSLGATVANKCGEAPIKLEFRK